MKSLLLRILLCYVLALSLVACGGGSSSSSGGGGQTDIVDGDIDGDIDGDTDGDIDGDTDGDIDGDTDGDTDGSGDSDGSGDGDSDGSGDGDSDGSGDGDSDGSGDGDSDGSGDGDSDGSGDGDSDGSGDGDDDIDEPIELTEITKANFKQITSSTVSSLVLSIPAIGVYDLFIDAVRAEALSQAQPLESSVNYSYGEYGCPLGGDASYTYTQEVTNDGEWIEDIYSLVVGFNNCVIEHFKYNSGYYTEHSALEIDAADTSNQKFEINKKADTEITFTADSHNFKLVYYSYFADNFGVPKNRANFYLIHSDGSEVSFLRYTQKSGGNDLLDTTYLDMLFPSNLSSTIYLEMDKKGSGNIQETYRINGKNDTLVKVEVVKPFGGGDDVYNVTGPGNCNAKNVSAMDLITANYCK